MRLQVSDYRIPIKSAPLSATDINAMHIDAEHCPKTVWHSMPVNKFFVNSYAQ